jgi:hypothetical protein
MFDIADSDGNGTLRYMRELVHSVQLTHQSNIDYFVSVSTSFCWQNHGGWSAPLIQRKIICFNHSAMECDDCIRNRNLLSILLLIHGFVCSLNCSTVTKLMDTVSFCIVVLIYLDSDTENGMPYVRNMQYMLDRDGSSTLSVFILVVLANFHRNVRLILILFNIVRLFVMRNCFVIAKYYTTFISTSWLRGMCLRVHRCY